MSQSNLGEPWRVPLNVVECFFIGQGPAMIPGDLQRQRQSVTVVVRLAEKATEWRERAVHPALAIWCDSHITIRGAWCEPLNQEVVERLNRRLAMAQSKKGC